MQLHVCTGGVRITRVRSKLEVIVSLARTRAMFFTAHSS